jgi:acyl homoserine lactone synthase
MIKDACDGLLDGMPNNLCFETPPQSADIWELTRLASIGGLDIARSILRATNAFLVKENAKTCLFLGPPAFLRMASGMGFNPVKLGPIVKNKDGGFLAFSCAVLT